MTGGYQQGRFDYDNYNLAKFPNKYYYAQGIRVFANPRHPFLTLQQAKYTHPI